MTDVKVLYGEYEDEWVDVHDLYAGDTLLEIIVSDQLTVTYTLENVTRFDVVNEVDS